MRKLRGKGNYTLKDQSFVLHSMASKMRLYHITLNGEGARDINYALVTWCRAMDGDANGYEFSRKLVAETRNKAFWKLAQLCCYPSDFEEVKDDQQTQ